MGSTLLTSKPFRTTLPCSPPAFQVRRAGATNGNDNCNRIKITESGRIAVKPLVCSTVIAILAAACATESVRAVQPKIVMVAAGVYALLGSGGEITPENGGRTANVAFIVGPRGIVVVDTGTSYREGEDIIAGETCLRNLRALLGEETMAASRVVKPDRLIDGNKTLELIGRPLRLIAPQWSSAPGAIAVFDERTSTLIAGSLVSIDRIPDTRDADPKAWRDALVQIESMRCRHLVPGYGPIGSCVDIDAFAHYLVELETRVEALMKEGVSLGELRDRCDLPEFARWDQYETLHPQNANRTYLRLEWSQFK